MALTDNLQAFYKLSDLTDSSGYNRILTNNGNVSFASGKIGDAAVFDGNNYLSRSQKFMSGASAFSLSCFVKCTSSTTYIYGEDAESSFILVSTHDNKVTFNFENGWNPIQSSSTITDDQWHHVVCVYDGGISAKLYFDGVEEASRNSIAATMPTSSAANFSLGAPPTGWGAMLNGSMDAVGIWNRALSDAEVTELYNSGTGLELEVILPTLVKMQAPVKFFGKVKFGA
jgi:arabinan endo-1,5-alpha-L-arabinosidase